MLGPMDEYPVHQVPQPIAWPGSSDRNFYDRAYYNAHDRTGNVFVITGIGYYPNLGVKDAFLLVRRGDTQTAVHLSDAIDQDRLNQHVGDYRIEVIEPLRKLRIVLDETEGIAADLTWEGLFDVVQEQPHIMRRGNRITLDAQRFAQVGTWSGRLSIDGEEKRTTAQGDGPVDATFNAVKQLFPHEARLQLYQVHAVTEGTDAQAEVSVRLEAGGRIATGKGADTDTLVASARAYVSAMNKLALRQQTGNPGALAAV